MPSPLYYSPLRYPGGKGKLAEYVKAVINVNGLQDGCYVEPYAGGAAVALELLLLDHVANIYINDLNASVHAFWSSVLNHTDELCDRIMKTPVNMKTWHKQKLIQAEPAIHSELDLGFSTFFLNRCNRSGIIGGGVIGGKDQTGKWKLDARYNREALIGRIQQVGRFRGRITLSNLDAVDFLTVWKRKAPPKLLIYLDPPYFVKGRGLYDSFYSSKDHAGIAKLVSSLKAVNWIVSYDDVPEIRDLYGDFRSIRYSLSYSAMDRYKGSEVMFFSDELEVPDMPLNAPIHLIAS